MGLCEHAETSQGGGGRQVGGAGLSCMTITLGERQSRRTQTCRVTRTLGEAGGDDGDHGVGLHDTPGLMLDGNSRYHEENRMPTTT